MPYITIDPSTATTIAPPSPDPAAPLTAAGTTLAEARSEILAMLTGRQDIEPERIDFWLNKAYIDIATSAQHDELKGSVEFATVADQPLYLLPDSVHTITFLARRDDSSNYGGVPLTKFDLSAYRTRKVSPISPTDRLSPTEYFRHNRVLVLYPTPVNVEDMILDYRLRPAPLTLDTHCPILQPEWHETWILLARKKILDGLAEWEAGMAAGGSLATHMRMRADAEANEDENRVARVSVPRTLADLRRRSDKKADFFEP
jgi:hypothetical protein